MTGNKEPGNKIKKVVVDGVEIGEIEATGDTLRDVKLASALLEKSGRGTRESKHPAYFIFRQAEAFSATSKHIHTSFLAKPPYNPAGFPTFIVVSVFAIELYLKALLKLAEKESRGHDLLRLFETLPQEFKNAVMAQDSLLRKKFKHELLNEFSVMLAKLNHAFEQWRYMYEHETLQVDLPPIIFLLVVLKSTFMEKLPE